MSLLFLSDTTFLDHILKEIEKDIDKPFHNMDNKVMVDDLMPYIRQKYPYASIFYYGSHQYIVVTAKAHTRLSNFFEKKYKQKLDEIEELKYNIKILNEC